MKRKWDQFVGYSGRIEEFLESRGIFGGRKGGKDKMLLAKIEIHETEVMEYSEQMFKERYLKIFQELNCCMERDYFVVF